MTDFGTQGAQQPGGGVSGPHGQALQYFVWLGGNTRTCQGSREHSRQTEHERYQKYLPTNEGFGPEIFCHMCREELRALNGNAQPYTT